MNDLGTLLAHALMLIEQQQYLIEAQREQIVLLRLEREPIRATNRVAADNADRSIDMRRLVIAVAVLVNVCAVATAQAQLVTNPTTLEADSASHYTAPVETYQVFFTQSGASSPFSQFNVPAGAVTILDPVLVKISINLRTTPGTTLNALPFGTQFTASLSAANAAGSSVRSTESNPFARAQTVPAAVTSVVVKP